MIPKMHKLEVRTNNYEIRANGTQHFGGTVNLPLEDKIKKQWVPMGLQGGRIRKAAKFKKTFPKIANTKNEKLAFVS